MTIGIEQFRHIGNMNVDRVGINGGGDQVVNAKLGFMDKVVSWLRPESNVAQQRTLDNQQVRMDFKNALVKAFGVDIANRVLQQQAGNAVNFVMSGRDLSSRNIRQMLDQASHFLVQTHQTNHQNVQNFLGQHGLIGPFHQVAVNMGIPAPLANGPELATAFKEAIKKHPEFNQRVLTNQELNDVAQQAIQKHFENKQAKFDKAYSGLAQHLYPVIGPMPLVGGPNGLAIPPFKETNNVFNDLQTRLQNGGALHNEPGNFATHALTSLTEIRNTGPVVSPTHFGRNEINQQQGQLNQQWIRLDQAERDLTAVPAGPLSPDAQVVKNALLAEITHQKTLIENKMQFNNEYLQNDTLSVKQATYNKVIWAQAAAVMINDEINDLINQRGLPNDHQIVLDLIQARNQIVQQAQQEYDQAPTNQRIDVEHPPFAQQKTDIKDAIKLAFRNAAQNAPNAEIRNALLNARSQVGDNMKSARLEALNSVQDWQPVHRTMVVSRDGVTQSYTSDIIPASKTNTAIGHELQQSGVQGVSAGTKDDPVNPRNLQVSQLRNEQGEVIHQKVRHGVLDSWEVGNNVQRQQASRTQAEKVLTFAVETTAPEFRDRLLQEANNPNPPQFKHVHVNFNLTTPVDRIVAAYNEGTMTENQFNGFAANHGQKQYNVYDANAQQNVQTPPVEVDTITFSFGVNDLAQDPKWYMNPLNAKAWSNVYDHNKTNLEKLVGDLQPGSTTGGYMGTIMERLKAEANNGNAEAVELMGKIQEQVDISRGLFISEQFRHGEGDPYKMSRHLTRVVDLGAQALRLLGDDTQALTQSEGCKSNKDRGGMQDVEDKAMVIIEDMGGKVLPNQTFDQQDQDIYNVVLTSSGQAENQTWNTGLPGSKNAKEAAERINNPEAQQYAMGFEAYVKA